MPSTRAATSTLAVTLVLAHSACVPIRDPSQPGQPLEASPKTIADASAACERLQSDRKVPVSCTTDYVDGVPSMIVGFRSLPEAREWLAPFAEHIGNPFCAAANRNGREARVYMTVGTGNEQQARKWSCELAKWGDWFANPPQPSQPPPQTIAEAVRACNDVQANRDVPVSCRTEDVNGVPSMIVGFASAADAKAYMPQLSQQVAGPFCDAANRANRRASLYMTLADSRARHFDCELQRWGDWFELAPRNAVDESSLEQL